MKLGLAGSTYNTQSIIANASRTINWYPERNEVEGGEAAFSLYPTPGLSVFSTVGAGPIRGQFVNDFDDRVYAVSGSDLYEISSLGVPSASFGAMDNDGKQCSMASNRYQTLILSGGKGYILSAGVLTIIADADFPGNLPNVKALKCYYIDGYFIVLADNNFFYISALNDGTSWNPIDSSTLVATSNKLRTMILDHREVFVFGNRKGGVLYNSGNPDFPFDAVPSGSIEYGAVPDSLTNMDNSVFLMSSDKNGSGMVMRLQGYQPQRVSDHGIEYNLQRSIHRGLDVDSTVAWSYQADGHSFAMFNVPGAETTPCYDAATRLWHERAWWDSVNGRYGPHRGINHIYAFGRHLVGDRELGLIYDMDIETYTDNASMIRRVRRHPHISAGTKTVTHKRLGIVMETGQGLAIASDVVGYDPQLTLQVSDNGGKSFYESGACSIGKIGEFGVTVEFRGLGSTFVSRVYQLVFTDPVPARIIEAYLDIGAGY